ncbi:MAG: T9SS type A sorting domain-containing protein [bacterium]
MKKYLFGLYLVAGIVLFFPDCARAQDVILAEDFNRSWSTINPPPGWEITFTADTSANDWHRAPDLGFHPWSDNTTPYAALGPGEDGEDMLTTPYLDLRGCTSPILRCSLGFMPGEGAYQALILGSVDSGPFAITIDDLTGRTIEPRQLIYDLSWAANHAGVRIQFAILTEANGITYWVIDNLTITAQRRATDVGVTAILAPQDTVDSGSVVIPRCQVKNFSSGPGTFWTHCRIGPWRDSVLVNDLAPGETTLVTFNSYPADTFGLLTVHFRTALPEDINPANDTLSKNVFVRPPNYYDLAALKILAPPILVPETTTVIPKGIIANYGTLEATFKAYFQIIFVGIPYYSDSLELTLGPGATDTITFSPWIATPPGTHQAILRVRIPHDINPANDTILSICIVRVPSHDVGAIAITSPTDTAPPGIITPQAKITNFGTYIESGFKTILSIYQGSNLIYQDTALILTLQPLETLLVNFDPWNATRGIFRVRCSTRLTIDAAPDNDLITKTTVIRSPILPGWQEMAPVPVGSSGKSVKDGGAITALYNRIFILRGNKTNDLLAYDIEADSWLVRAQLPPGSGGKVVSKGGALVSDGFRYIYATKGYSTTTFLRYDAWLDTWESRRDVPLGPTRKTIKGGNKMVYITRQDTGFVYLLKGYKNEFWRYNTITDTWEILPDAPLGPSGKDAYKEGSFIVYDGQNIIYAVKAKYNEVFAFDLGLNQWLTTTFQKFPLAGRLGRQKKVKDGAGGGWWNQAMYCLKGGNTTEFWRFFPQENRWEELDTIPQVGFTGRKKRVKQGGGLASMGNGIFFALKGGKTQEFWCYRSPETGPGIEEKPLGFLPSANLKLFPNPAKGRVFVSLKNLLADKAYITIYDAAGRNCLSIFASQPNLELNCSHLSPGSYFVRARAGTKEAIAKLILR